MCVLRKTEIANLTKQCGVEFLPFFLVHRMDTRFSNTQFLLTPNGRRALEARGADIWLETTVSSDCLGTQRVFYFRLTVCRMASRCC
jgi:hypothetical protein